MPIVTDVTTGYASVNGLEMYYEIHGAGRPLLLLHGSFMTVESFSPLLSGLATTRQIIVPELQAHGRTADIDRPMSYEHLADDAAALLRHLDIEQADVAGYSLGGGVALQLAIRHPALVRKLVLVSASLSKQGDYPEVASGIARITPELFDGTPWKETYLNVAPDPAGFPSLVERIKEMSRRPKEWLDEARGIASPVFVVLGDSDGTKPEHAVEMFRLFGGGVMGDLAGIPASQLAILPGTHHVGVLARSDWLVEMITAFLDAPLPEESQGDRTPDGG